MDYDPATVADALVKPGAVDAVAICPADANQPESTTDDASVREAVADVQTSTTAPDDTASEPVTDADGEPESPHVREFEELKQELSQVEYDELIADLEETTIPGEFDGDADLEPYFDDYADGDDASADLSVSESSESVLESPQDASTNSSKTASSDGGMHADPLGADQAQVSPGAVVDALVTALENDQVSDEQRATLADELETAPPNRVMVRLEHLQREVDELTAYKDSMESFIDEYGSGDALLDQFDTLNDSITHLEADLQDLETTQDHLQGRVEDVETRADELASLQSTVSDLKSDLEEQVDDLQQSLDSDIGPRLDDVEDDVTAVEKRIASMEAETVDAVDDLAEELETVSERLDALVQWRNQLRAAFGASPD